eukprot:TRINITY_DN9239_c0_g1_i1.p1 TRINITY_DN9239_c0_g1~~TRINITY_DN9239_c0_g1_i1.p1  ORF type:complete len:330 (-),score=47.31 TRINITY_DN9239_c0_g1_i1:28-1017(-)
MGGIVASKAFMPPESSYTEDSMGSNFVWIPCKNGKERIPAAFYPTPTQADDTFSIIFSHGNAEDIGQMASWMEYLSQCLNVNVMCYDYKGYGLYRGECSESAAYSDIDSVFKYMVNTLKIPGYRIVLLGRSLGSGPTTHLASTLWDKYLYKLRAAKGTGGFFSSFNCFSTTDPEENLDFPPLAGVILQSPIASAIRVVSDTLAKLPIDIFVNINKIHKIRSPIFIIHGTEDLVVPYSHGTALFEKAGVNGYSFLSLEGAGHNDIEVDFGEQYLEELGKYFDYLKTEINLIGNPERESSSSSSSSCSEEEACDLVGTMTELDEEQATEPL